MPNEIDQTHDPKLRSWIESANDPDTDFPIQNLPFVSFARKAAGADRMLGVVIGDCVVHLGELDGAKLLDCEADVRFNVSDLAKQGIDGVKRTRQNISELLRADNPRLRDDTALRQRAVFKLADVEPQLPDHLGNYTDFYASIHHASAVGAMFRPDNPLLPNYKHVPIGYHGRASSIVLSGTEVRRPRGQTKADDAPEPTFGPCTMLDYELEVGLFVGRGNALGEPIPIDLAEEHILGLCLVNDWSARDIQKWEYQPLGPFLAKSFATSISPYVLTMEALAPFRCPAMNRPAGDPRPLPYLFSERDQRLGGIDITLEVFLASRQMRDRGMAPARLSKGSFRDMYWTIAQLLTHHASNGCNMQPGDLLASGTVSGTPPDSRGCLLELTWDAPGKPRRPITLPTGEARVFLADGDEVIFKGYCEREGYRRIGFGECRGIIVPAPA